MYEKKIIGKSGNKVTFIFFNITLYYKCMYIYQLIINILKIIYKVFKEDVWPLRYYFLVFLVFITSFTLEMLTINRIIRFIVTCIILLMYKKMHNYLEKKNLNVNINIKYLPILMWVNIIQNTVLYIIWKWDIYIYDKLVKLINNKKVLIIMLWNISLPIKIIYIRFYRILNIIKNLTFVEFMFHRIYGFIVSILIFSDIINYVYKITGGPLNLIIYIYLTMYSINIIYTIYYYYIKIYKVKNNEDESNFILYAIKNMLKKTIIYKMIEDYLEMLKNIEINQVYENRQKISLMGSYIKKYIQNINIKNLESLLNKIPEQWRFWIYNNKSLFKNLLYISYKDIDIITKLAMLKMSKMLNIYNNKYHDIYILLMMHITECIKTFESLLYYKYFVYEKGSKKNIENYSTQMISKEEYENIYNIYFLILKNILFYIWSYEYCILKDKKKLTKLYVVEDIKLVNGYHIYEIEPIITESDTVLHKDLNNNNMDSEIINERSYILSKLTDLLQGQNFNNIIYIEFKENSDLKDIILCYQKYLKLLKINTVYDNNLLLLKTEITKSYFMELNNLIILLEKEWEKNLLNINLDTKPVFLKLMKYNKLKITKCV